jgi:hypothetical protein
VYRFVDGAVACARKRGALRALGIGGERRCRGTIRWGGYGGALSGGYAVDTVESMKFLFDLKSLLVSVA